MQHLVFSLRDLGVGFLMLSNAVWSIWITARVRELVAARREQTAKRLIPRALPRVERPLSIPSINDWRNEPTLLDRTAPARESA